MIYLKTSNYFFKQLNKYFCSLSQHVIRKHKEDSNAVSDVLKLLHHFEM